MTQFSFNAESGTAGNALVAGTGNTFTLPAPAGGATGTYSATGKAHGSLGLRIQGPTTGDQYKPYQDLGADSAQMRFRGYFTLNSLPGAAADLVYHVFGSGGSFAQAMIVSLNSSNQLFVKNSAGSTLSTFTTALSAATVYRLETFTLQGGTTSTGTIECYLYAGDSTSPLFTYTSSTVNSGTNPVRRLAFGKLVTTGTLDITWDDILIDNTGTHADLGPVGGANVVPSVSAGPTQAVVAGSTVTLSFTATDSDGTISTLTGAGVGPVTPTLSGSASGTGTASATYGPTSTLSTVGAYTFTATATDNSGGTSTGSTTVYVYPASGTNSDPTAAATGSGAVVGAGSALAAITGTAAPATKYLEGPSGGGAFSPITLGPEGPGAITIYVEGYYNGGALTRTANFYKADGTTLIYTDTWSLAASDAEHPCVFDSAALAAIPNNTDRGALVLKVTDA